MTKNTPKSSFFLSVVYSLGQMTIGLFLHPYQTMQSLAQDKIFLLMTLLPSAILAMAVLIWRLLLVSLLRLLVSCDTATFFCLGIVFIAEWGALFCAYWQILLLYLYIRFSLVYRTA